MSLTVGRRQFLSQLGRSGAALAAGSWLAASATPRPAARRAPSSTRLASAPTSIAGCSARFSSTSAGPSTPASTSPTRRWPTSTASARTCSPRSRSWACRSCATPAATSSPATTGSTASAPRTSGRPSSSGPGTRSRPTSSARTSSSSGAELVGTEPLLGFNLGTGTPEQAVAYVEYCNVDQGTKWSDLRREHGYEQPHNVRYWCLGNEMDGPWQMGRMTGPRVRPQGARRRPADPRHRSRRCSSSPAARATRSCRPTSSGTARCSRSATTRSTPSRCTTTTATRRRSPATTPRATWR